MGSTGRFCVVAGAILAIASAGPLPAQVPEPVLQFQPEQPHAGQPVLARITAYMTWCEFAPEILVQPGQIRIDLRLPNCGGGISPPLPSVRTVTVAIGRLPAGQYNVQLFLSQGNPLPALSATLGVSARIVPVRSRLGLLLLAALIVLFACRQGGRGSRPRRGPSAQP